MFHIKTFNAIAPEGMARFEDENYTIDQDQAEHGIILRSEKLQR